MKYLLTVVALTIFAVPAFAQEYQCINVMQCTGEWDAYTTTVNSVAGLKVGDLLSVGITNLVFEDECVEDPYFYALMSGADGNQDCSGTNPNVTVPWVFDWDSLAHVHFGDLWVVTWTP